MEAVSIKIEHLQLNDGQIVGLPSNPRTIKDEKFDALVKSIKTDPEMLELRPLIVYPINRSYVVIAGNMRLTAMRELKYSKCLCFVLPHTTPIEKLKAITIKDNISFGQDDWEALANDWDMDDLEDWGMDLPKSFTDLGAEDTEEEEETEKPDSWFIHIRFDSEKACKKAYDQFIDKGLDAEIVN